MTRSSAGALWAPVLLLGAVLLTYHRLAYGPGVPGGYDTQTYFFAYRQAVATALRAGHFPLWDADLFLGAPLFANVQAAVLYPPNLLYLIWPTPQAIAASLILHVWWACWGMALLCRRSFGVLWAGAIVGGAMFGLGGFFSAQAGHVNQVNAAAWLPWLLLCFDAAWQRRSPALAALAALIVAVQFLAGHTQESYFILCVAAAWGLWRLLQARRSRPTLLAIVGAGAVALAGGGLLAAAQLLPTLELTGQSIRAGGLTLPEASSFSLRPDQLLIELLPGYAYQPASTEHIAYVGAIGLLFALIGAIGARRRTGAWLLYLLVAAPLALAFGQYDPLWRLAFHIVPGFSSFRVPARWLYVYSFGLAALGAIGAGLLWERRPARQARWVTAGLALGIFACLLGAGAVALGRLAAPPAVAPALTALATLAWLPVATTRGPAAVARPLLLAAAVLELVTAASRLDLNQPIPLAVYSDERQTVAFLQGHPDYGRALSIAQDRYSPGDTAAWQQLASESTGPDSVYRASVAVKLQDVLSPNLPLAYGARSVDGYDGGILPLADYVALKRAFVPPCDTCANPDALLRFELASPPLASWLDLLGVGALIDDRLHEFRYDGVSYDLTITLPVAPGASANLGSFPPTAVTALGLITDVAGARPPAGASVGQVAVTDAAGRITEFELVAGENTDALTGASPVQPATGLRDPPDGHAYLAIVPLPDRPWLRSIKVTSALSAGTLEVRSLALRDALTQSAIAVPPAANASRVLSGDINIYHLDGAGAPAFLAVADQVTASDTEATRLLSSADFPLGQDVVLSFPDFGPRLSLFGRALRRADGIVQRDPRPLPAPPPAAAHTGSVTVTAQSPDASHFVALVMTDGPAYLVLKQSWYPGWRASVDGRRVPIYRADLALQAIPVPTGRHTVVVDYRPGSVLLGAALSAVGILLLLLVLAVGGRLAGRMAGAEAPRPATSRSKRFSASAAVGPAGSSAGAASVSSAAMRRPEVSSGASAASNSSRVSPPGTGRPTPGATVGSSASRSR